MLKFNGAAGHAHTSLGASYSVGWNAESSLYYKLRVVQYAISDLAGTSPAATLPAGKTSITDRHLALSAAGAAASAQSVAPGYRYYYSVQACPTSSGKNCGYASSYISVEYDLAAPLLSVANGAGEYATSATPPQHYSFDGIYTLTWAAVSGATYYEYKDGEDEPCSLGVDIQTTATSKLFRSNLSRTKNLNYCIRSCGSAQDAAKKICGKWGPNLSITAQKLPAPTLTSGSTSESSGIFTLSFGASLPTGVALSKYVLEKEQSGAWQADSSCASAISSNPSNPVSCALNLSTTDAGPHKYRAQSCVLDTSNAQHCSGTRSSVLALTVPQCTEASLGGWADGSCKNGKREQTRTCTDGTEADGSCDWDCSKLELTQLVTDSACAACVPRLETSWAKGSCASGRREWTRSCTDGTEGDGSCDWDCSNVFADEAGG